MSTLSSISLAFFIITIALFLGVMLFRRFGKFDNVNHQRAYWATLGALAAFSLVFWIVATIAGGAWTAARDESYKTTGTLIGFFFAATCICLGLAILIPKEKKVISIALTASFFVLALAFLGCSFYLGRLMVGNETSTQLALLLI